MGLNTVYKAKSFDLSDLNGISNETLAMHFKLYEGYVTNTNVLNERIAELIRTGELDATKTAAYSEMKRRFGFEYNGMVLHEYYFENMKKQGTGDANIDWAATYQDPSNGAISNHWINLHETGNVAGYSPILIMDVWEHAFIKDYAPADRPKYIEAFFSNIDWDVVNGRLSAVGSAAA
jgi:Fe-Mn family superoxide dismutase